MQKPIALSGADALRALAAALLSTACLDAHALQLGNIDARSGFGEPFLARVPVTRTEGETFRGACFSILSEAPPRGQSALEGASLELRRHQRGAELVIRTAQPVSQPLVSILLSAACPGSKVPATQRRYAVALRGASVASPSTGSAATESSASSPAPATPAAATPVPSPETITTLTARPGDTLSSIAHDIFPSGRSVRADYLAAMRAANPSLADRADDAELPEGTPVALPDLRTFMRHTKTARAPARAAPSASSSTPANAAPREATAPRASKAARRAIAESPSEAPPAQAPAARKSAPSREAAAPRLRIDSGRAFELKLSGPSMDLAPSRAVTDAQRAELRKRLAILDSDDRTSAMLAMREDIRKLEAQVSELRLKLAQAPSIPAAVPAPVTPSKSSAPPVPATSAPQAPPPAPPSPPAAAAAPAPAATKATEPTPPPAPAAAPAPTTAVAPTPPSATAPTVSPPANVEVQKAPIAARPAETQGSEPKPDSEPAHKVRVVPAPASAGEWYEADWFLPAALVVVLVLLVLVVWRWRARRAAEAEGFEYEQAEEPSSEEFVVADEIAPPTRQVAAEPEPAEPGEWVQTARITAEDNVELRRRYIEERFPEILSGALAIHDPASVVKAARLLYDDGAIARAIELLQLAIEQDPTPKAPWLALFEILRRESLAQEYAILARRFGHRFAAAPEWPAVLAAGREIDPDNTLYADSTQTFDARGNDWLPAAAPATGGALAAQLRGELMQGASVSEGDLVADPTPALRKAESIDLA